MSIVTFQMKTHSRVDVTDQVADQLNDCVKHHCKPGIFKMVVGKRKETFYVANCQHDDCGKISTTLEETVAAWNKWNPKQ